MFARRRTPVNHPDGRSPSYKDVVLCDNAPFPLTLPGTLIGTIWDEVNQGMSARGGSEVGGLLIGSRTESASTIATAVVPIRIEYHFGPSFRLSLGDLKGVRTLMASLQNDSSGTVVGFYRSRTRNDSLSEESESELLALLEQSHRSFATDFHYYVALTPVSKTVMTASAS